ncbi:MAG: FkbM family methyltransferase [Candidatus Gastranaerophilales bacterium]|nr:FkbM family methyltransferase [Candidatus Gastranaerophilales bacterium]
MDEFDYLNDYDLQKRLNQLSKKYKKIIIYGAGKLSDHIFCNYNLKKLNITAVADKKYENTNCETFHNIPAIRTEDIKNINADCILIFNKNANELISYLINLLNNKKTKIEWILEQDFSYFIKNKIKYSKPKKLDEKYIFTFWEPVNKIPDYLKLCLKTWEKFLPEYKIIILNYSNLNEWLGYEYYDEYLYKNFSLPKQADAIRAKLLNKYGGIWFDIDTIITSNKIKDILNLKSDTILFNRHVAFITSKKGSYFTRKWLKKINKKLFWHKFYNCHKNILKYFYSIEKQAKLNQWSYFSNSITDEIITKSNEKQIKSLDKFKYFALPENNFFNTKSQAGIEQYVEFYFNNDYSDFVLNNEHGVILLHNSFTPQNYKKMGEREFLEQNNTLSKVLKNVLENDCNKKLNCINTPQTKPAAAKIPVKLDIYAKLKDSEKYEKTPLLYKFFNNFSITQDEYKNLISNLDDKSAFEISRVIKRIEQVTKDYSIEYKDLFTQEELDSFKKMHENLYRVIQKFDNNIYAYKNYFLPTWHFEHNVFYFNHNMEGINLDYIKDKDIIDAGGYIGDSAIVLSKYTDKKVISFEADPENYKLFKKTIELNNAKNITVENFGLGEKPDKLLFRSCQSGSRIAREEDKIVNEVDIITLDDYVRKNNIKCGLIKVDIEGAEESFLKGAYNTIKEQRPTILLSIYHNAHDLKYLKPMIESWNLGYKFRIVSPYNGYIVTETMLICERDDI